MNSIFLFLIGPILTWLPTVAFGVASFAVAFLYLSRKNISGSAWWDWWIVKYKLAHYIVGFRVLYAALLTIGQYYVWSIDGFGKAFLDSPLGPQVPVPFVHQFAWIFNTTWGYFIFYCFERFWLNVIVSTIIAYIFFWFLQGLRKYNDRFFEAGEVELGLAQGLILGWPQIILFIPFVFLAVVAVSLVRLIRFKELYTTLGAPFVIAGIIMFICGAFLLKLLNLSVLTL